MANCLLASKNLSFNILDFSLTCSSSKKEWGHNHSVPLGGLMGVQWD